MKKAIMIVLVMAMIAIGSLGQAQAADTYRVKSGDTLWQISQKIGVPIEFIIQKNGLADPGSIYAGQKLVIRISLSNNNGQNAPQTERNYIHYTVKSGDVLWKIAQRFNTTVEKIVSANGIVPPYYIYIGQNLTIPVTGSTNNDGNSGNNNNGGGYNNPQANQNYTYYTVQPGDILWNIAQRYDTTVQQLVELNKIRNAYDLYAGRKLLVPLAVNKQNDNQQPAPTGNTNQGTYVPYFFYRVQPGDMVWTIADRFGVRTSTLLRYNNITDIENIKEDDVLIIPLDNSSKLSYIKNASQKLNSYYRVQSNESLADIANYYQIPEEGLRAINHMTASETVYTGQRLLMPVNPALFARHELYTVKNGGEDIYQIAYNKGVSIRSILKANYLKDVNAHFQAGTVLLIPLDNQSQTVWIDYDENGNPVNSIFSN